MIRLEDDAVNHKGFFAANLPNKSYQTIEETYEEIRINATPIAI